MKKSVYAACAAALLFGVAQGAPTVEIAAGEALSEAAWPVVYAEGPRPLNFEIVRDATGAWLHAFNETTMIVR